MINNQSDNSASPMVYDVIICGAGASGLLAAITAAQNNSKVLVLEKMKKAGQKILITGGGRCNLTNTKQISAFIDSFDSKTNFIKPALKEFSQKSLLNFFNSNGLSTYISDENQAYPVSNKSTDVLNCLLNICSKLNIDIQYDCSVNSIIVNENKISGVTTQNALYKSNTVVLATGGKSYPQLGSDGNGYELATAVGHTIVEPVPALTFLLTRETWPMQCAGLSLDLATLYIDNQNIKLKTKETGSCLFTHKGISGPAVLNLSKYISRLLLNEKEIPIRVRPVSKMTRNDWNEYFIYIQQNMGTKRLRTLLGEKLPARFVQMILQLASIDTEIRSAEVTRNDKKILLEFLDLGVPLTVTSTGDFTSAMVTSGGVNCDEIDSHTMQSKKISGLFFCGEVIDVDGPCGGYNLQWAFSSGYLAGKSATTFKCEEM